MQVSRNIALPKRITWVKPVWNLLRLVLVICIIWYLYQGFLTNKNLTADFSAFTIAWSLSNIGLLGFAFILLPANWLLEAKKWHIIAQKKSFTLGQALKGVLMGLSLDNVLPLGTGGISGRLSTLKVGERLSRVPGILAGQVLQSVVTLTFGLVGFYVLYSEQPEQFSWQSSFYYLLVGALISIGISIFFSRQSLIRLFQPLMDYSLRSWLVLFTLSLSRYLVFLLQLILLFQLFSPEVSLATSFTLATWVFAARTFMPKVTNLERLGIRALAVIFFAEMFSLEPAGLLVAVTVLWFINLAIPSIVGLYYLVSSNRTSSLN
jgi:hypothetical protein